MIAVEIDLGRLHSLRHGFRPEAHKALGTAFRAESFRLKTVSENAIRAGSLGLAGTAPLTRRERRSALLPPLGALAGGGGRRSFIGYQVKADLTGVWGAEIGFGRAVSRARNSAGRRRQLVELFGGGPHTITRTDQKRIAKKIRKRLGEPVQRSRRNGRDRRPRRPGRHPWQDIRTFIPAVGETLRWPARDWVAAVVRRERRNTAENIAAIYDRKLKRVGFEKRWWDERGRFRG